MTDQKPNPGHGYVVRELLGKGYWKKVYRAVRRGEWHDFALACFIHKPVGADVLYRELRVVLHDRLQEGPERKNVAKIYDVFLGDDHEIYLVEELLYRRLEALTHLKVVDRFLQLARDLSNGLKSLHEIGLVHRDLKLDNCGIDHSGNAKIFDLGSATSEGGELQGTILSRAPELFSRDAKITKEADVWALGAVLFALRTGEYPFVNESEVTTRHAPENKVARAHFEETVAKRSQATDSQSRLRKKIEGHFPVGAREILFEMLDFDPGKRPSASKATEQWGELLQSWSTVSPTSSEPSDTTHLQAEMAKDFVAYLDAYLLGNAGMSTLQWERVSKAIDGIESNPQIHLSLLQDLKNLREKVNLLRATEA